MLTGTEIETKEDEGELVTCAQFAQRHLIRLRDVKRAATRLKIGRAVEGVRLFREQEMLEALAPKLEEIRRRREGFIYYNVLAVDDDQENLDAIRRILRKTCNVFLAASGERALQILGSETIEVIIADQRMPRMSGTELLWRSLDINPGAIRIMLSAYTDPDALVEAINRCRIHHFLTKPISREALRSGIDAAFEALRAARRVAPLIPDMRAEEPVRLAQGGAGPNPALDLRCVARYVPAE